MRKMKINYRKTGDTRRSKRLFVMNSAFDTVSFPVQVRKFRLQPAGAPKDSPGTGRVEPQEIPQVRRQEKKKPSQLHSLLPGIA